MHLLLKFIRLPIRNQGLLLAVALVVVTVRIALWTLPFRILRHLLFKIGTQAPLPLSMRDAILPERWALAVRTVSQYIPSASCLTQAIATHLLLRKAGYPSTLRIGVTKGHDQGIEAHAWVESSGNIVIGGTEQSLAGYVHLPAIVSHV